MFLFARVALVAAVMMSVSIAATPAFATDVHVAVSGVVGSAGTLRASVCRPDEYASRRCAFNATVAARPGTVDLVVRGVPPGRYVVIVHHDRTGDGVVHTDWLGIPIDGVGVSKNVEGRFGPPDFDSTAIDISGPAIGAEIVLRREPAG